MSWLFDVVLPWLVGVPVALWVVYRRPGVTLFVIGVAVSLVLWTVAPEASVASLSVTSAAALAAWLAGRERRRRLSDGAREVLGYPLVALVAVSVAAVFVGPAWLSLAGFTVLAGMALRLAWNAQDTRTRRAGRHLGYQAELPAAQLAGVEWGTVAPLAVSGPCPRCPGLLVSSVRPPADAAGLVVRAVCPDCGARLVGVVDPARPSAGLIWTDLAERKAAG